MAQRARLGAPRPETRQDFPWHRARWTALSVHDLLSGDRRMEAESYLAGGYGLRLAFEHRAQGWKRLSQYANVWQPLRLKGIQVSEELGTPFLAATQLFDIRPVPRKWLSLDRTHGSEGRFVNSGQILVTCSGAVGRATLALRAHERTLISHDLLRVDPHNRGEWGWIYSYLRSAQARAMMSSSQYGHVIKHLETTHLDALPVPHLKPSLLEEFESRVATILALRNEAYTLTTEAEDLFSRAIGKIDPVAETGYLVRASKLSQSRRRLDGAYYAPVPLAIEAAFSKLSLKVESLSDLTRRVWLMNRAKRYLGDGGINYVSADELFSVNPLENKRVLVAPDDGHEDFFVEPGWIVMARSGQTYGLNGSAILTTDRHVNKFFSDDLIRIIPDREKIRPGYLLVTLTHRQLGRPLLIREAYGTSIPHLDPIDVSRFPVVRLSRSVEDSIADRAEEGALSRARAEAAEESLAGAAEEIIDRFIAGSSDEFVASGLNLV